MCKVLRWLDKHGDLSAISDKENNFCDFLFDFLNTNHFKKGSSLLGKNFHANFFPYREDHFSEGSKNNSIGLSPLEVYYFPLNIENKIKLVVYQEYFLTEAICLDLWRI